MKFKYEDLENWQLALGLIKAILLLINHLSKNQVVGDVMSNEYRLAQAAGDTAFTANPPCCVVNDTASVTILLF